MKTATLVIWFWILFIARGLFYISLVPLWEGFDEWAHYAVVQNVALGTRAGLTGGNRVSLEVETSLRLVPRPDDGISRDTYWRLPARERWNNEEALRTMPADWARQPARDAVRAYETQQAPLYYWIAALAYRGIQGSPFLTRVWLLRLLSLLLGSAVIPFIFLLARNVTGSEVKATGIAALTAVTPQLMMAVNHVSNDGLAISMGAALLFALFRWKEQPHSTSRALVLGCLLGLALLTKAYFLCLVPPVSVFAAITAVRKRVPRQALALLACAVVISAWWYLRTWSSTGSLSGEQIEIAGKNSEMSLVNAALHVKWRPAIDFLFISHIWVGNWSFLVLRSWMYHFVAVMAAVSAIGLGVYVAKHRAAKKRPSREDVALLGGIFIAFVVALAYHVVRAFQASGTLGTMGYYLFAVIGAELILVTTGLETVMPSKLAPAVLPAAAVCFAGIDLFGANFYAIPYYAGFIAHLPNGGLPTLHVGQLAGGGLHLMLARVAVNKPEFLNPTVLAAIWALYLAATAALTVVAVWPAVRGNLRDVGAGEWSRA